MHEIMGKVARAHTFSGKADVSKARDGRGQKRKNQQNTNGKRV